MIMWYECTQIKLLVFNNIINGITNIYLVTFTTVHGISNIVIIRFWDMALIGTIKKRVKNLGILSQFFQINQNIL